MYEKLGVVALSRVQEKSGVVALSMRWSLVRTVTRDDVGLLVEQTCRELDVWAVHLEGDRTNRAARERYLSKGFRDNERQWLTPRLGRRAEQPRHIARDES